MIDQKSSLVNPTLFESESHGSILDQPLVEKMVDLVLPSVNRASVVESEPHTAQVLLVSSVSNEMEGNPPIPKVHEINSPIPITQEGSSHVPRITPPSSLVTSFDWSRLTGYHLLSYVPFQITVQAYNMVVPSTVIDEGASVSILSSISWQALRSPHLVPVT